MDTLQAVLRRLLEAQPDVPEKLRDEVVRASGEGRDALVNLFRRLAGEARRRAEGHHAGLQTLIRRP